MVRLRWFLICLVAIALSACDPTLSRRPLPHVTPQSNSLGQLEAIAPARLTIVMGQTIYVPIYAYIYQFNSQDSPINLAATLSIRNTDLTHPLILKAVRYYNSKGQLIQTYLENPVKLEPLASTEVFVEADDVTGGSGANFIVEWVAENKINEPVIEAVMISTASTQGIAFVSQGRVIKQQKLPK